MSRVTLSELSWWLLTAAMVAGYYTNIAWLSAIAAIGFWGMLAAMVFIFAWVLSVAIGIVKLGKDKEAEALEALDNFCRDRGWGSRLYSSLRLFLLLFVLSATGWIATAVVYILIIMILWAARYLIRKALRRLAIGHHEYESMIKAPRELF